MNDQGFRYVIESIREPLIVVNRQGELCFANAAAFSLLCRGGGMPSKPLGLFPRAGTSEITLFPRSGRASVQRICVAQTEWGGESACVATFQDITDVTERLRTEEGLRQGEIRRRLILESSIDCIVVTDTNDRIVEFNPAAETTFGYTRQEVLGRAMTALLIAPPEREHFRESLRQRLADGDEAQVGRRVEVTALRSDHAELPVEAAISVARHFGEAIFTIAIHDITRRRHEHQKLVEQTQVLRDALNALERARERERQVLAAIPSIFIGVDDSGKVTHFNPSAERTYGLAAGDVIGKPLFELGIDWQADRVSKAIVDCSKSGVVQRIEDLHIADCSGNQRILTMTVNRIESYNNEDTGVVVVALDVTERKALEAQLILAHKMESIGHLAAGIAHEINTPTQYVSDNTRFLRDAFRDLRLALERHESLRTQARQGRVASEAVEDIESFLREIDLPFLTEEIPNAIEQSMEGLDRVAQIVRAMKQFSHPDQDELELANINSAIQNTALVARNEWKYVADMELDLDPDLPAVPCLVGRFNQAILNLIVNAAQAIGDVTNQGASGKGKIVISTRREDHEVEIRVADTGTGIPVKIRNRIFDPFFTTKQVGKGTGQGLAIVHSIIVEKHGGSITVESEEGHGATFILRLPLKRDASNDEEQV